MLLLLLLLLYSAAFAFCHDNTPSLSPSQFNGKARNGLQLLFFVDTVFGCQLLNNLNIQIDLMKS